MLNRADGRIAFRFHARDVNLVLGLRVPGASVPFRVLVDGEGLQAMRTDSTSTTTATERSPNSGSISWSRERGSITDRTLEIIFLAPGVEAYVFTFG